MRLGAGAAIVGSEVVHGDISISDGVVEAVGLSPAGRGWAVPGFVDLQVNGFHGVDFLNAGAEDIVRAGHALARTGVVAYQPTLITGPRATTLHAAEEFARAGPTSGARVIGIHLEGPFLSPHRAGTHPLNYLQDPDWRFLEPIMAAGPVTMVTLAPELPGATALISRLAAAGVVVSLGHSDATAAQAASGFDAGARAVTHLFNAMRPFSHRNPGIVGTALSRSDVYLGVIADGVHVAPEALLTVWRAGASRTYVVTDAIAAAGMGPGQWRLGEVEVDVEAGTARRKDGTLAGSVGMMDESFRHLVALGVPLVDSVAMTSLNARRLMGLTDGNLTPGTAADVVVLDDGYRVSDVFIDGVGVT
jgi:N-acetylglucosamine-6-phosphate deacetylase